METNTNDKILTELINSLKNQKRPETIKAPVYGLYSEKEKTFIYSDADENYSIECADIKDKEVRNAKAFALSIAEELKRRGNLTGEKSTVNINLEGGIFYPDDDFGGYQIKFSRLNSQQWNWTKKLINQTVNHKQFLVWLQGLKPSFDAFVFKDLFAKFVQLKIVGQSKIVSNPIITENGQESGYTCRYKLSDGTDGEENFPSGFKVTVPFAKAGDKFYDIPIDLLFTRNEDDEIEITILCPEFENIEEKAVIDEAEYIKEQTKQYKELLILSDF